MDDNETDPTDLYAPSEGTEARNTNEPATLVEPDEPVGDPNTFPDVFPADEETAEEPPPSPSEFRALARDVASVLREQRDSTAQEDARRATGLIAALFAVSILLQAASLVADLLGRFFP